MVKFWYFNKMQTVLQAKVIQHILSFAYQFGATCIKYFSNLPQTEEEQQNTINFQFFDNKSLEYTTKIDFKKLDEWIEHPNVQRLQISTHDPIFLEIKKVFEVILTMDRSVMDGWKYKNTFMNVVKMHYDKYENKKVYFEQMNWIDSFVTSFIWNLYH
jgi:hypothetical protein